MQSVQRLLKQPFNPKRIYLIEDYVFGQGIGTMSALLQQVMAELHQLSTQEKWQLMSHLISDLQNQTASQPLDNPNSVTELHGENLVLGHEKLEQNSTRQREDEVEVFMQELEGSWGNLSREDVDDQLERQRRFDWDE